MAAITPGTGGTCKSSTAEGQLQEIISYLVLNQGQSSTNPDNAQNVVANHSQAGRVFSGTFRFDATQTINALGHIEIEATPYLVGTNFLCGDGGTFKGNTPEKYALEVLMHLQNLERSGNNPQNRNFITGSYNSDIGRFDGSFTLPVSFSMDGSGNVLYSVVPYLT